MGPGAYGGKWAAMLLILLFRGAGAFSLDALIERLRGRTQGDRTHLNVNLGANS
jgi:hypothetical protein